jgi:cytochrome c-type biogenesis protein CcmH
VRGLALPLAAAALLALGGLVLVEVLRPAAPPTRAEQARQIASELRCPDCQALSVAESRTESAVAIRAQIDELLATGESPDAVRRYFVARYGSWILLAPATPVVWWLPSFVLAIGALGLLGWLLRPRSSPPAVVAGAPGDELRRRVREEEAELDA